MTDERLYMVHFVRWLL